jgi:hypothetical protein
MPCGMTLPPCLRRITAATDTMPSGLPCCMGYHAATPQRNSMPCAITWREGYDAVWNDHVAVRYILPNGMQFRLGYHAAVGYRVVGSPIGFQAPGALRAWMCALHTRARHPRGPRQYVE